MGAKKEQGLEGDAYRSASGQWSWVVRREGVDVVNGAGYGTRDEALTAMYTEFEEQRSQTESV